MPYQDAATNFVKPLSRAVGTLGMTALRLADVTTIGFTFPLFAID